jgi:hypothetical protein
MSSKKIKGKKPLKDSEANLKLPTAMTHANPKFQMGNPMLTVDTLKETGKSYVVLHITTSIITKKMSTHNRGIQGKALSGG